MKNFYKIFLRLNHYELKSLLAISNNFFNFVSAFVSFVVLCSFPALAQSPAATLSAGAITGRVVSDNGQPLQNVVVLATPVGENFGGTTRRENTDESGKFQLTNLPATAYTVRVYLPGYVPVANAGGSEKESYHRIGDNLSITLTKGSVITGSVQAANGEPMMGVRVTAIRIADLEGRNRPGDVLATSTRFTDDRGIYRIYGLTAGQYVVCAGGSSGSMPMITPFDQDAPTYYPNAPRSKATTITLQSGTEAGGIDIRYRGERGYLVSGTVSYGLGVKEDINRSISIRLINRESGVIEGIQYLWGRDTAHNFTFQGIANGDYLLIAERSDNDSSVISEPRRITIKNSDISAGDLLLLRLAAVHGQISAESDPATAQNDFCLKLDLAAQEVVVLARRADGQPASGQLFNKALEASPKTDNNFTIEPMLAGHYYLETRLPGEQWYLKAIRMLLPKPDNKPDSKPDSKPGPSATTTEKPQFIDIIDGLDVGTGTQVDGLVMVVSNGAAQLQGNVVVSGNNGAEKAALPDNLRVYLVPGETAQANNVLRYAETTVNKRGEFSFTNLAPGRYWLLARVAPAIESESRINQKAATPLAWNVVERLKLRQEAERANQPITLKVCQQLLDATVKFTKEEQRTTKNTK